MAFCRGRSGETAWERVRRMTDTRDLTEGVIWKKLLLFFLPIAVGTVFQQLYNAVDAVIVGKFVGTQALAAVGGSPAVLTNVIIGFFVALTGGASVVIAQQYGARNHETVARATSTALIFAALLGVLLGAALCMAAPFLLRLLKTPADTLADAVTYLKIYALGSPFILIFNMGCGIERSVGNSRRPLLYSVICCFVNIAADLLFVVVWHFGVAGVAYATVLTEGVSVLLVCRDLLRTKDSYRLDLHRLSFSPLLLKPMMRIGIPAGAESALYGVSNMILQAGINTLGTVVVASWALSGKLDALYWALINAFGAALTSFVGQNYGAGKRERIRATTKTGFIMALGGTVVLSGLIMLLARPLLGLFTDDAEVCAVSYRIMTYFVPIYFTWTAIEVLSAVLRGVGDALVPVAIIAVGVCALRIVWVYTVFRVYPTLFVLSMSYPVSWVVTDAALFLYYKRWSLLSRRKTA